MSTVEPELAAATNIDTSAAKAWNLNMVRAMNVTEPFGHKKWQRADAASRTMDSTGRNTPLWRVTRKILRDHLRAIRPWRVNGIIGGYCSTHICLRRSEPWRHSSVDTRGINLMISLKMIGAYLHATHAHSSVVVTSVALPPAYRVGCSPDWRRLDTCEHDTLMSI